MSGSIIVLLGEELRALLAISPLIFTTVIISPHFIDEETETGRLRNLPKAQPRFELKSNSKTCIFNYSDTFPNLF